MDDLFLSLGRLFAEQLTVTDFFVAFVIVAIDEYIIKKAVLKGNEKYKAVYTFAPLALGVLGYLIYGIATGAVWYTCLLHGAIVGLTSMGSYDVILRVGKGKVGSSVKEIGEAVKEEVEK